MGTNPNIYSSVINVSGATNTLSTTTSTWSMNCGETIILSSYLDLEKNQFIISYRQKNNMYFTTGTNTMTSPDLIWKE